MAKQLSAPPVYSYSHIILFTFEGANEGIYPDGSSFQMADVVAPDILAQVYDSNDLAERDIPQAAFASGFHIRLYAPEYDLLVKKYEAAIKR